jgi:UDP-N-acetylglucosamine 1-carboxyvinyltransferase
MRASFYGSWAVVARYGSAKVSLPGGCAWGPRPVDCIEGTRKTRAQKSQIEAGYGMANAQKLKGAKSISIFQASGQPATY